MQNQINSSQYRNGEEHKLRVKLRSGASIINVKPLFTYDSKCIIVGSGTDLKVFSIASGECVQTLRKHKTQIVSIQPNINNHLQILSCSQDGTLIRWDFMEGQALEEYHLDVTNVAAFYAPSSKNWFIITQNPHLGFYELFSFKVNNISHLELLMKQVDSKENKVAFGVESKFVAVVKGSSLRVWDIEEKKIYVHLIGKIKFTCVACHPTEDIIATGNDNGRVLLWSTVLSTKPVRSIYHWHTLPVTDIVFSSEGSYLFSGGGEASLVKWNLNAEERKILPRLGLPISKLASSRNNDYVLTAHQDNAIQIVSSVFQVVQIIQGLTKGHFQGKIGDHGTVSTGMLYDSRLQALVMNGKPGHLQFYKIHEDKQLFNLDIVGRNMITQEREAVISNLDVWKTAIDDKGQWLATVEYWNDGKMSPEIRLKFWEFDETKQTYVLNTFVFLPHNQEINYLGFQPQSENSNSSPLAVTTSCDGKFKLWSLSDESSYASNKKERWDCESVGYYRGLPAGDACFSEDGSLLAVAFGPVATLWTPDSVTLKARFCLPHADKDIRQIMFGRGSCSHLLVCSNSSEITVWNLLTLTTLLTIKCELQLLVQDKKSDIFAAFCNSQNLFIFKPDNPYPIFFMACASFKPIIAGAFVPVPKVSQDESPEWYTKSELFYLNEDQNLLNITDEPEEDENVNASKLTVEKNIPVTPFGMLQAEHKKTDVKTDVTKKHNIINKAEREFNLADVSCPTNQNPIALCSLILPSLLIPAKKIKEEKNPVPLNSEDKTNINSIFEPMEVDEKPSKTRKSELPPDFIGITDFSFLQDLIEFSKEG